MRIPKEGCLFNNDCEGDRERKSTFTDTTLCVKCGAA